MILKKSKYYYFLNVAKVEKCGKKSQNMLKSAKCGENVAKTQITVII